MKKFARYRFLVVFALLVLGTQSAFAQAKNELQIQYTVELSDVASRQFHITTDIKNIDQNRLDLSLPTWTPGWYTVENYGKNLLRFTIKDEKGNRLPFTMSKKQTWNVITKGIKQIRIEYDYVATILALNQAKIADDYAFFTGIELFLQPIGHRTTPSTLHFKIPKDWALISPLKETTDPMTFIAADYDTLVDAPAQMGKFDLTTFQIDGKPHHFVATPAGVFSKEKTKAYTEMLTKVALAQKDIFGDLPYEKFVYYYFFAPPESNASGALEHNNSFVQFAYGGADAKPEQLISTGAHEFFHLWNVRRFRPAEMWPYDYSTENASPLLWISEGFTSYYSPLSLYRAGIIDEKTFLTRTAGAASGVENNEARKYISPANASVSTWVGYDSPVAFGISYYTAGQNLAALLDISIINDTDGKAGLDDLMRALYNDHYKKGKGFTSDDTIAIINGFTKKDYRDFYDRYVFDVQVPDYNKIFGFAGFRLNKEKNDAPIFGFNARFRDGGMRINSVEPGSPASSAGLKAGDVVTKIDGKKPENAGLDDLAGKTVKLTVRRGEGEQEILMSVGTRVYEVFSLVDMENPTEKQKRVRARWLKK